MKKNIKRRRLRTQEGVTSIYVVLFTTLIMGLIVLGFATIAVSGSRRTTNNDLSNSAYDSALAGVEDAKIALIEYHKCIDRAGSGSVGTLSCSEVINQMKNGIRNQDCDTVAKVLGRDYSASEVKINEGAVGSLSNELNQAYTCVRITEDLNNYQSTVSGTDRVRLIPIRTDRNIQKIEFNWGYGDISGTSGYSYFPPKSSISLDALAPAIVLDIFQTDNTFSLGELSVNNGDSGTDHATLVLRPNVTSGTVSPTQIPANKVLDVSDKHDNEPISVNCSTTSTNADGFHCLSEITLPNTYNGGTRNDSTFFLRVELPYGDTGTEFSVRLHDTGGNVVNFVGVQAQIDSTGRANDLYRRVETRIELVENNIPYPEFALQTNSAIEKNFWVTRNCWAYEDGTSRTCNNTGTATTGL